jgi:hypothetical protein
VAVKESGSRETPVPLTPDQWTQLEAKATDQVRSPSSYIAKLIVEDLTRGL